MNLAFAPSRRNIFNSFLPSWRATFIACNTFFLSSSCRYRTTDTRSDNTTSNEHNNIPLVEASGFWAWLAQGWDGLSELE
jgi:hypothetical protein